MKNLIIHFIPAKSKKSLVKEIFSRSSFQTNNVNNSEECTSRRPACSSLFGATVVQERFRVSGIKV